MTPAARASLGVAPQAAAEVMAIAASVAVVLPGGRSLIAIEGPEEPPPGPSHLLADGRRSDWTARCWPVVGADGTARGWAGLALLDGALLRTVEVHDAAGLCRLTISPAPRLDVSPEPIAAFVRSLGLSCRDTFDFLVATLLSDQPAAPEARRWHRDFVAGFITAAAEPDGFVEVLAAPDCGGLFVQGWSVSLEAGRATLATLDGGLVLCSGAASVFKRDDILPPGRGFCFFSPDWHARDLGGLNAVFLEEEGRLRRLDVAPGALLRLAGEGATEHVAHMLPQLAGPETALAAFRRVCRPRYAGIDTLSATLLPVAAAFDAVFQAPDGGLLALGWLLDPLARVKRVILKSTANLYAPLQDRWSPLPRPDLHVGFAPDPRFARLLDDGDAQHGFLAYAQGRVDQVEGAETYLELVLDDESCLFRPLTVIRLDGRDRLPQILSAVSPSDPNLDAIVETVLAPFLAGLPARPHRPRAGAQRPIPLGATGPGPAGSARQVAAVMPFRSFAQLQPVMALLAGTPEASALDFALVTTRSVAAGLGERLGDAFRFYGLKGQLVLTSEREGPAAQVEAGIRASEADQILLWSPEALPTGPGWLSRLLAEAEAVARPGLLSPSLLYEDGSVCFGGGATAESPSPLLGYPAAWLPRGAARAVSAGSAEVALVGRATLARAGGFSGRVFSDGLAHRDLARRLHAAGCGTWCSGSVEFWMIGDHGAQAPDPYARLMEKVDAALIAGRQREDVA